MRCLGVLVVVACYAGSALAQGKQKQADALFEEGRKLLAAAGDDREKVKVACAKFDEAIKLDPEAPGTMLNLGLCNEKLEKYKTALYWFRKAQARAAETNLPDYETAAKQHTVDLASKVATIKIAFSTPPPPDTRVKIDGEEVAPADYLHAEVDAGHHTIVAGATGKKIWQQEFDVTGRGGQTITVELVEGENAVIVDRGKSRRMLAIYVAIGGGALLLTSGIISYYALTKYDQCVVLENKTIDTDAIMNGTCPAMNPSEATDYANSYQRLAQNVGTGFFIAGTVTIGVAAYLYFTAPAKERVDRTVLVPSVGPEHAGFVVSGRF